MKTIMRSVGSIPYKGFYTPEKNSGEVLVDPSVYIPTQELLARMLRGENFEPRFVPQYEIQDINALSTEEAFALLDPTKSAGFDLADATGLNLEARRNLEAERIRVEELKKDEQRASEEAKKANVGLT